MSRPRDPGPPRRRIVTATVGVAALSLAAVVAVPSEAEPVAVVNPSLEQDADGNGVPDCFTPAGWGVSSGGFERTHQAHTGRWAGRLTVTGYRHGDRKLIPMMSPPCAPSVSPGSSYRVSVWYQSTVWSVLVVYLLRPGGWAYWTEGPGRPPSIGYRRSVLDLPPIPADATAISFGQAIIANGTIVTDDYDLVRLADPASSSTARPASPMSSTPSSTTATARPPEDCRNGHVALGFDDGPDAYADQLLDILEAKQAKASHFVIGQKITPESAAVVRRMHRLGHPVGNHSWTHPHLTALPDADVLAELTRTSDRLVEIGLPRPDLWRPPYEDADPRVRAIARGLGLSEVLWDLDTNDWQEITPEEITRRIVDGARSGSIILLHERIPNTVAAVPGTIDGLRARGFCLGVVRSSPTYHEQTRSYAEVGP